MRTSSLPDSLVRGFFPHPVRLRQASRRVEEHELIVQQQRAAQAVKSLRTRLSDV
jgi:hypothetical protein